MRDIFKNLRDSFEEAVLGDAFGLEPEEIARLLLYANRFSAGAMIGDGLCDGQLGYFLLNGVFFSISFAMSHDINFNYIEECERIFYKEPCSLGCAAGVAASALT